MTAELLTSEEWHAAWLSLRVASCAALIGLPPAVLVGYYLARSRSRGKWLLESLVSLPLALPPVVVGTLLLAVLAPRGPVGALLLEGFGLKLVFTWWASVVASVVVGFPLMTRAVRIAFQAVDPRLEGAARCLGAGPIKAFLTVSLPLSRRGVIAAGILGFARSLGEFGATIMVAGNVEGQTRTIPLAIYTLANQAGGMEQSWRLVALAIGLACMAMAACEWLERRRPDDAA